MAATLEEILVSVWRQALVEEARTVTVGDKSFPVLRTTQSQLREVDFQFEDHELRGLEQNPKTTSRWARLAREGKKVMQFQTQGATLRSRSEEHTSELQSPDHLVCRLLLE